MTSRFRLPAGRTYNVRASELARDRQNTEVVCNILLLDNTVQAFKVNKNELGQVLLDIVFKHLDLTERDYFGLQLADDSTDNPSDSEQHQEMCAASESVEINASTKKGISELGKVHRGLCEHFKHMNKIEDSLPIRAKLTMETWNFKLAESHVGRSSNVEHKSLHDMDETAYNQQKSDSEQLREECAAGVSSKFDPSTKTINEHREGKFEIRKRTEEEGMKTDKGRCQDSCSSFKNIKPIKEDLLPQRRKLKIVTCKDKTESHVGRSSDAEQKRIHDMDETAHSQRIV
ncbi:uncharacterized protein LOC144256697 isoform X3 [Urocitellus parryii]